MLNNLNRGLGLPDGYPFVLSTPAIEKFRFVHEVIEGAAPRITKPTGSRSEPERVGVMILWLANRPFNTPP